MTTSPVSFDSPLLVGRVQANLATVRGRIASTGRNPEAIRVVAVTKTFPASYVRAARQAGLRAVGENYVNELCAKRAELADEPVEWLFLGVIQSNKIHRLVDCADMICSVARNKELEKFASFDKPPTVYIQVDFTGAAQRNGASASDVPGLVAMAQRLGIDVAGLMTVAPPDPQGARRAFTATSALADDLGIAGRSMGMSEDLEIACECGSTEVRIGRALFGARDGSAPLA